MHPPTKNNSSYNFFFVKIMAWSVVLVGLGTTTVCLIMYKDVSERYDQRCLYAPPVVKLITSLAKTLKASTLCQSVCAHWSNDQVGIETK